jgi:hypothetical protein
MEIRDRSPNRICVNLGCEDRHFLFSPVPVEQMQASLQTIGEPRNACAYGTQLAREFLAAFPAIPILRLCVRPGEAYVAPTERLAHDVSTWGRSTIDLALHVLGRFEPFESPFAV